MNVDPSELGRFQPVAENLVLAATERAQLHGSACGDPVSLIEIAAHLGFDKGAYTTRQMRPLLAGLTEARALEASRRFSREHWALTSAGRALVARARGDGEQLELPESPQHRLWREKHTQAVEGMDDYRARLREALAQTDGLIDGKSGDSLAWQTLTKRLKVRSELLGSAIHCAREWPEPDDRKRDAQDSHPLEDRRRILWHPDEHV
jgi:hypothetical protein